MNNKMNPVMLAVLCAVSSFTYAENDTNSAYNFSYYQELPSNSYHADNRYKLVALNNSAEQVETVVPKIESDPETVSQTENETLVGNDTIKVTQEYHELKYSLQNACEKKGGFELTKGLLKDNLRRFFNLYYPEYVMVDFIDRHTVFNDACIKKDQPKIMLHNIIKDYEVQGFGVTAIDITGNDVFALFYENDTRFSKYLRRAK